jgi:chaperonin GroES
MAGLNPGDPGRTVRRPGALLPAKRWASPRPPHPNRKDSAVAKLKPVGNNVLIRPDKAGDKSPGGVLIPDVARERPQRGTVLAVGPGALNDKGVRIPPDVSEGDVVLFGRYQAVGSAEVADLKDLVVVDGGSIIAVVG